MTAQTTYKTVSDLIKSSNEYILSANSILGVAGYNMMAQTRCRLNMISEATDYQLEDGNFFQNYIANRPFTIQLDGQISELFYENKANANLLTTTAKTARTAFNIANTVKLVSDNVGQVAGLLQDGEEAKTEDITSTALDIYANVKDNFLDDSEIKRAVRFFKALRDSKQFLALTTPFGVYSNMAIEEVDFETNNAMVGACNIKIRLKHMTKVEVSGSRAKPKQTIKQAREDIQEEYKAIREGAIQVFDTVSSLFGDL